MLQEETGQGALARRLRGIRVGRGWSLGQLSDRTGIDRPTLSRIERGLTRHPRLDTLEKIASAYGVSLPDITGEAPPQPPAPLVTRTSVMVPVISRASAGAARPWVETGDWVAVAPPRSARPEKLLAAVVTGDCLSPFVLPGDIVIWDQSQRTPRDGDPVVVSDNGALLVKWFRKRADGSHFLATNQGDELEPDGGILEGVVVATQRPPVVDPRVRASSGGVVAVEEFLSRRAPDRSVASRSETP